MKRRIKLTEGTLRKMIRESVRKILKEETGLDWRTLDSAAQKAYQEKTKEVPTMYGSTTERDMDLVSKFRRGKADAINKKYFDGQDEETYFPNGGNFADGEYGLEPSVYWGKMSYGPGGEYDDSPVMYYGNGAFVGGYKGVANYEDVLRAFNGDEDKANNFMKLCQEFYDYRKGKTKYQKGKGWQ